MSVQRKNGGGGGLRRFFCWASILWTLFLLLDSGFGVASCAPLSHGHRPEKRRDVSENQVPEPLRASPPPRGVTETGMGGERAPPCSHCISDVVDEAREAAKRRALQESLMLPRGRRDKGRGVWPMPGTPGSRGQFWVRGRHLMTGTRGTGKVRARRKEKPLGGPGARLFVVRGGCLLRSEKRRARKCLTFSNKCLTFVKHVGNARGENFRNLCPQAPPAPNDPTSQASPALGKLREFIRLKKKQH